MLKLVSFNLRYSWDGDGINSFIHRVGNILVKIGTEKPDVICFQEGTDENIDFLRKNLNDYTIVFNQRGKDFCGEGVAVAFLKEKFELIGLDCFWLSDTPKVPASKFEGQVGWQRICQCLTFKRLCDSKLFSVYNTHLDNNSEEIRVKEIECILKHIKKENPVFDIPFFITGDFNDTPNSETITFCNTNTYLQIIDLTSNIETSFHDFGRMNKPFKIDYIFADKQSAALSYETLAWTDCVNGIYLSDHYPICINIDF